MAIITIPAGTLIPMPHDAHVWTYYRVLDERAAQLYTLEQNEEMLRWLLNC